MTLIGCSAASYCVKRSCLVAVVALAVLVGAPVSAEPPASKPPSPAKAETTSQRIAFVRLRFAGEQVQLVDFKIVPGRFKTAPEPAGERILLQVIGLSGKPLWEGWLNDPRTRVLEFDDAKEHGRRRAMVVAVPNAELTVRVPFIEDGQAVHIWRATPVKGSGAHYQQLTSVQLREN